jgi:Gram-negative bacterial TonB protein C-terminal
MKKVMLLALLIFGFGVNAQKSTEDETIYTTTEKNPVYVGGLKALYSFFCENIKSPKDIPTDKRLNKVFVKFVVEKDGSVTHPEIMRGVSDDCNKEAIRVINLLPKWQAGGMMKYGAWTPQRIYFMVPVAFFQNKTDCEKSYSQSLRGY